MSVNTRELELEEEVIGLEREVEDLEDQVRDLEGVIDNNRALNDAWDLEQEVEKLEEKVIFPREEITLPEQMKFEFLQENWDRISLEDLERLIK
tara:strand:+ start:15 stop:296 length:282 start_codon:yes stop_codon:yes gene_type:complete